MSVQPASRYVEGEFVWVPAGTTSRYVVYLNTITALTVPYDVHIIRDGESLQLLAGWYYNDPKKWWILADANPQIYCPTDLVPGQRMRVPK